jgi:aminomethyltransferase
MPLPTPFHPRTSALCTSLAWKEWAGCHAVRRYDVYHEREYHALRHAVVMQDVTPLFKYDVTGPDAAALLSRVLVRGVTKMGLGRVSYVTWCDDRGKVLDDGTVTRFEERRFRLTSAEPAFAWLDRCARGLDVTLVDRSRDLVALAVQGPLARRLVTDLVGAPGAELRFFRALETQLAGFDLVVTRTGYTGDLGYELWAPAENALELWDLVTEAGRPIGILPMGLDALDVARVEAGFVLGMVDYVHAKHAEIPEQRSTPYELGFDWMVKLDRAPFVGQAALRAEKERGPRRRLVGLEIDWDQFEALHEALGLPPHLAAETCREGVPVYKDGQQVGQATSRTWSPACKRYLALATVASEHAAVGSELQIEITVEYQRFSGLARVAEKPFFQPERTRA